MSHTPFHDDDDGRTDLEDEDDDSEAPPLDEMDAVVVSDIVWGKHVSIWYPAKVCSKHEVPAAIIRKLGRLEGKYIVKWWNEENYSALPGYRIQPLARNKVDEKRATKSVQIAKNYHAALAQLP